MYKIPSDLIRMIGKRKVIPFIGAGFSAPADIPMWNELIEKVAEEQEHEYFCREDCHNQIPYNEVKKSCLNDPLQIAEYYYVKNEKDIGAIRHSIARNLFKEKFSPFKSGAHVELANLGAQQIYTTNYDELIETTYKKLRLPYQVVALPKHIAKSSDNKTQIVKYHGDLRYEKTLVLTESSYFSRLAYESPMDLKFRSDLLGRSVLFMGYSFRDINIRIIWFKLMQMIKDIKGSNSYIVRFEPDPVLETLYEAAGIDVIVLDPDGETIEKDSDGKIKLDSEGKKIVNKDAQTELIADFLHELGRRAHSDGIIPGSTIQMICSEALLNRVEKDCRNAIDAKDKSASTIYKFESLLAATERDIRAEIRGKLDKILEKIAENPGLVSKSEDLILFTISYIKKYGFSSWVSSVVVGGLIRQNTRKHLLETDISWKKLLGEKILFLCAESLLNIFTDEIDALKIGYINEDDIPYLLDLAFRIKSAYLVRPEDKALISKAESLIDELAKFYSEAKDYSIKASEKPNIDAIIKQIKEKASDKDFK